MVLPQPQPGAPLPRSLVEELEARLRALTEEYESRLSDTPEVDDLSQVVHGRAL
jgi:hypothetical protein